MISDECRLCGDQKSKASSFRFPKSCAHTTVNKHTHTHTRATEATVTVSDFSVFVGPPVLKHWRKELKELCYCELVMYNSIVAGICSLT